MSAQPCEHREVRYEDGWMVCKNPACDEAWPVSSRDPALLRATPRQKAGWLGEPEPVAKKA